MAPSSSTPRRVLCVLEQPSDFNISFTLCHVRNMSYKLGINEPLGRHTEFLRGCFRRDAEVF